MQTIFKIHFPFLNWHKNYGWMQYVLTKVFYIPMRFTYIKIIFVNNLKAPS